MKCICGYEEEYIEGCSLKPFIELHSQNNELRIIDNERYIQVGLFACPECGTVKVEV